MTLHGATDGAAVANAVAITSITTVAPVPAYPMSRDNEAECGCGSRPPPR
jgi:hypothetical protein